MKTWLTKNSVSLRGIKDTGRKSSQLPGSGPSFVEIAAPPQKQLMRVKMRVVVFRKRKANNSGKSSSYLLQSEWCNGQSTAVVQSPSIGWLKSHMLAKPVLLCFYEKSIIHKRSICFCHASGFSAMNCAPTELAL